MAAEPVATAVKTISFEKLPNILILHSDIGSADYYTGIIFPTENDPSSFRIMPYSEGFGVREVVSVSPTSLTIEIGYRASYVMEYKLIGFR